ncbi:Secretion-regulating guanine nucleotide exchange factor [Hypsizygus marmoreus]|uniref:Secretion-regulating guanine nucleotide exchange factor n=1 Tax=Hypsizygus marmoreus TaxID=39966 RepID=A0A369K5G7_HYPMA|nr:Secretion-regulating guanine nucleotide exchange factor [Hypsizygus marmoreus]
MSSSILLSSGSNAHGQLSNGTVDDSHEFLPCSFYSFPPGTMPPQTRRVVDIASGANHTIILLETYDSSGALQTDIWGCGDGSSGQLGATYKAGEPSAIFRPIELSLGREGLDGHHVKLVSACWETIYVVLDGEGKGDILLSLGSDDFGHLGVGDVNKGKGREITKPFHIVEFRHLTIEGLSFTDATITIQSITSGQRHVVACLQVSWNHGRTRNCMVGWGASRHGQLGIHAKDGRPIPFLSTPSIVYIDDPNDPTTSTALGNQHTVFLHASGKVTALGSNRKGQLNRLENAQRVTSLGCTWNGTYVLVRRDDGNTQILATGSHAHGQLGRKLTIRPSSVNFPSLAPVELDPSSNNGHVSAIACGTEHILALVSGPAEVSGTSVWGWGWNEHGNLGTGTTDNVFVPVKIWPLASKDETQASHKAIAIWAGSGTSWIYATAR